MDIGGAGELGVLGAAVVSSLLGWISARKAERHVRPNGRGTVIEIVERNQDSLHVVLEKLIELDKRVDRLEDELRKAA